MEFNDSIERKNNKKKKKKQEMIQLIITVRQCCNYFVVNIPLFRINKKKRID